MENKSYRILNLEGAWLNLNKGIFTYFTKDKNANSIYTATMPYSLETIRAFGVLQDEVIKIGNDNATKLFVNFKFTKDYIDDTDNDNVATKIKKKKLRKLIYTSKVTIDDTEYCFFKRGASKARTANVIFVKKEYYNKLFMPCLLGLKFIEGKEYDITSMQAYISLIMSGIIGTVEVRPDEILIINDVISPSFKAKQTVTKRDELGNIYQDIDTFDVINNMTDGQVLADKSLFVGDILTTSTTALLRNDFFKGNACRTKLQEYYKANNITQVYDMYRGWIDSSKIKLVITPSACKYLKFSDQFVDDKACYLNWLNNIPSTFGIVKTDHVGNYGYSNRLSYQILNSLNLNKAEVRSLVKDELDYLKLLKDNTLKTSADIKTLNRKDKAQNRDERNKMSYFLNLVAAKDDETSTGDMISSLLNKNSDFRFTGQFKDWKNKQIQDYMSNLRTGAIRVKNSLYAIMVSNPYEMLIATTTEGNKVSNSILDGWECYSPRFANNTELMQVRYPQINAGNIGYVINKYHYEYKWFGYWVDNKPQFDFVVFVNSWNVDNMNRLQGCDWDVDSSFLCDNKLLVSKAKESQAWATPVNGIKGSKELKVYDNQSLAKLDNYLGGSTASIGKIVNKSAIFNAYMYNAINNEYPQEYIDACYNASSILSSFSQIAIDMAKKNFEGLSLHKKMSKLNKTTYVNNKSEDELILQYAFDMENTEEIDTEKYEKDQIKNIDKQIYRFVNKNKDKVIVHTKKMIVPYFFTYTAKDNSFRIPTKMDCSVDYLEEILDEFITKAIETDKVDIKDLFCLQKDLIGRNYNTTKLDEARKIISDCQQQLNNNKFNNLDDKKEAKRKKNIRKWIKKTAISNLKKLELNEKTVYKILLRAFKVDASYTNHKLLNTDKEGNTITYYDDLLEEDFCIEYTELSEMTMTVLTLIYNSYKDIFLKCFINKREEIELVQFWD